MLKCGLKAKKNLAFSLKTHLDRDVCLDDFAEECDYIDDRFSVFAEFVIDREADCQ